MSDDDTLFGFSQQTGEIIYAEEAKQEAITRAELHADDQWKRDALSAVECVARILPEFVADDVWHMLDALGESSTHEHRAMGAILTTAARKGLCKATDRYVPSSRVVNHRRPQRVWQSLVCKAEVA